MAYQVSWSPEARDDLNAIAEFIGRDSPYHASKVVEKFLEVARNLVAFPRAARAVPELRDPTIREKHLFSYRLIYEISDDQIIIHGILHQKRLFKNIQSRFSEK